MGSRPQVGRAIARVAAVHGPLTGGTRPPKLISTNLQRRDTSMSTTFAAQSAPAAVGRTPRDTRTLRRVVVAVLLPLGPLAIAAIRGLMPYFSAGSSEDTITQTAADLGRMDAVLWLSVLAMIGLVPSALGAARLAQRRAPVLSLLAMGLLVPSFIMLFFGSGDTTLRVLAGSGLDPATAARLYDESISSGPMILSLVVFVVGHVVGTVLLGFALWRARVVPTWAAIAVIVSQPLHFVAFVVLGVQALDVVAWGLTALGLGVAGLRVLRTPNDEWDLPAVAR
jgi:hypothetical protein